MRKNAHLSAVTKAPSMAQTVQQLKYDTFLVYITNTFNFLLGNAGNIGELSNTFQGLISSLPYKGYYGGGGDGGTNGTTS